MVGLRIDDRELRRAFRDAHPELMAVDYWEGMQRALREGQGAEGAKLPDRPAPAPSARQNACAAPPKRRPAPNRPSWLLAYHQRQLLPDIGL